MSVVWSICGAGSGVGKTIVAEKLCAALGGALHAKCGHGTPKATGKTPHFFRDLDDLQQFVESHRGEAGHLVVESNAFARLGRGDITVFIDGAEAHTDFRDDVAALREAADIDVNGLAPGDDWAETLAEKLPDPPLRDEVCRILAEQQRYLFGPAAGVRTKVWFELDSQRVFGAGLAALLENIEASGSLRKAAESADISYRHAWDLIKTAEASLGQPLITRQAGGARGGGSSLSAAGRHMLAVFDRLAREVADFARGRFDQLYHAPEADDA